jgi:hypothetical protein
MKEQDYTSVRTRIPVDRNALDMDIDALSVTVNRVTSQERALDAARMTVGKAFTSKSPTEGWWRKILFARHSPIRTVEFDIILRGVPEWIHTHLVRHHVGIEKFVRTQRPDRTDDDRKRSEIPQGECKDMLLSINAESLMLISQKRLCKQASPETRYIWSRVVDEVAKIDPILANLCVPECVYRGVCPEMKCCGFSITEEACDWRQDYLGSYQDSRVI